MWQQQGARAENRNRHSQKERFVKLEDPWRSLPVHISLINPHLSCLVIHLIWEYPFLTASNMDQYWFEYPYGAYIASSKSKSYLRGDDPSTFRPYEMVNVWTSLPSGKSWLRDPRFLLGLLLYFSGFVALDPRAMLVGNDHITGVAWCIMRITFIQSWKHD